MEGAGPNLSGDDDSFDEFNSVDENAFPRYGYASSFLQRAGEENSRDNGPRTAQRFGDEDGRNFGREAQGSSDEEPVITEEEIYWELEEIEKLVDLVLVTYPTEPRDWDAISEKMGKSVRNCKNWLSFLSQVDDLQRIYQERFSKASQEKDPSVEEPSKKRPRPDSEEKGDTQEEPANEGGEKNQETSEPTRKRRRKAAIEVDREWECPIMGCGKSYGTLKSLRYHHQLKHDHIAFNETAAVARRNYKLAGVQPNLSNQFSIPVSALLSNYLHTPVNPLVSALQGNPRLAENIPYLSDNPYHSIPHLFNIASNIDPSRALQNQLSLAMLNNNAQRLALANTGLENLTAGSRGEGHDPTEDDLSHPAAHSLGVARNSGSLSNISYPHWNGISGISNSLITGVSQPFQLYNLNIPRSTIVEQSQTQQSPQTVTESLQAAAEENIIPTANDPQTLQRVDHDAASIFRSTDLDAHHSPWNDVT